MISLKILGPIGGQPQRKILIATKHKIGGIYLGVGDFDLDAAS
jgi:hypothetical protein